MDKKAVVHIYTMEYYSAIKKNTFESVLMRWMKLEPIINSAVMNIGVQVSLSILVSSVCMPSSGIAES